MIDMMTYNDTRDGPATVERIVKKYVNMSGSLLLFIVPTDQDFDTVLGKDIVDPHADKTIYVLTKLDLLCKQGEEVAKSRLDKIVDETKEPRVVVLGKLELGKTEAQTLGSFDSTMSRYEGEIQLGCADLGGVIEMRMREHLGRQLPELRKAVLTARDDKNARKKDLLVRDPRELVLNVVEKVRDVIRDNKAQKEAFLRDQRDAIMVGVKNAHVILGETGICSSSSACSADRPQLARDPPSSSRLAGHPSDALLRVGDC
jgi:hypothetical protein